MRISDWSSDVCSSDLEFAGRIETAGARCALAGDDAGAGDDASGLRLADHQVAAEAIELIVVKAGLAAIDRGAALAGKTLVTPMRRRAYRGGGLGQANFKSLTSRQITLNASPHATTLFAWTPKYG